MLNIDIFLPYSFQFKKINKDKKEKMGQEKRKANRQKEKGEIAGEEERPDKQSGRIEKKEKNRKDGRNKTRQRRTSNGV